MRTNKALQKAATGATLVALAMLLSVASPNLAQAQDKTAFFGYRGTDTGLGDSEVYVVERGDSCTLVNAICTSGFMGHPQGGQTPTNIRDQILTGTGLDTGPGAGLAANCGGSGFASTAVGARDIQMLRSGTNFDVCAYGDGGPGSAVKIVGDGVLATSGPICGNIFVEGLIAKLKFESPALGTWGVVSLAGLLTLILAHRLRRFRSGVAG